MELDTLVDNSASHPNEEDLQKNLSQLNKKLSSLLLRTEHQITITNVNIHIHNIIQVALCNDTIFISYNFRKPNQSMPSKNFKLKTTKQFCVILKNG